MVAIVGEMAHHDGGRWTVDCDSLPPPPHPYPFPHTPSSLPSSSLPFFRHTEPQLHGFLHVSDAIAVMSEAAKIDRKIERNEEVGPSAGVVVAVKDNICMTDMQTTARSRVLEGYQPPFDATAMRKLRGSGSIIVGKTNLDELGIGSTTETSAYQAKGVRKRL
ncbi:glutamyl-tRNA(Gln) amidotransferase subunit A, chloroplastic/mitochondrial-like [Rhododendron vialii]|uniref:glutamyl-tRNA(Gln) amidotransferase subunit A, chloroplastic/mitochondrial-like n=1 Tax=Rhododendron vialii TaxID=182163 RepID=UPI0026601923|nr:glutamyl-tRNA(Gln) amidotransferase subunit A, chloroplastic/mitochondrial-like [Rhododendron vialii]